MMRLLSAFLLLFALAVTAAAQSDPDPDAILVDATFVPCSDSTESLLILQDGRAVYAIGDRGAAFNITEGLLDDLREVVDSTRSHVETKHMDSCTTIGVILYGPRFLLINSAKPAPQSRELYNRLERMRKLGQRRMDGTIDRFSEKVQGEPDTNVLTAPAAVPGEIHRRVRLSPVAREWRCNGTVYVAAMVSPQGEVRQAFVQRVRTRGKCASILATTALRAVLLASFQPATNKRGRPMLSWIEVEVPFSRQRAAQ